MSPTTTVDVVSSWERDQALCAAWDQLVSRAPRGAVTQSPTWLREWTSIFGARDGCKSLVVAVREGGVLIGVAPLVSRWRLRRGVLPLRTLEWMGTGEAEAHEILSEYVGISAEAGREEEVARQVAMAIAGGALGSFDELWLRSMDGSAIVTRALSSALGAAGLSVEVSAETASHYIPLPGSFDAYLAALSGSRRQRLRRSLRKFEKTVGIPTLRRAGHPSEVTEARRVLESLHTERWEDDGRSGAFDSPLFRCFHAQVLPALCRQGRAELYVLEAGGRAIAATYNLLVAGRVQFYQSGRVTDLPPGISPGIVIHALAIQNSIERGCVEYDFLAGDTRYKRELALATRPLTSLRATRGAVLSRLGDWVEKGARLASSARRWSVSLKSKVQAEGDQKAQAADHDEEQVDESEANSPG